MQQVGEPRLAEQKSESSDGLTHLLRQLKSRRAECPHQPNLSHLVDAISAVLACRIQPDNKNRYEMAKQATKWRVRRTDTVPSPGTETMQVHPKKAK